METQDLSPTHTLPLHLHVSHTPGDLVTWMQTALREAQLPQGGWAGDGEGRSKPVGGPSAAGIRCIVGNHGCWPLWTPGVPGLNDFRGQLCLCPRQPLWEGWRYGA